MLAAVGFGTLGPLARAAGEAGLSPLTFATWRAIVSTAVLVTILLLMVRAGRAGLTAWSAVSRLERLQLVAMGIFVSGTTVALFAAFERTTIALVLIFFYTYPTIVAIAAVRLYGEPLGPNRIAAIALASAGMLLVVLAPQLERGGLSIEPLGAFLALGAAVCQACYALVAARGYASVPALQAATFIRGFATAVYAVVLVPALLLVGEGAALTDQVSSPDAWPPILLAATFGAALPAAALVAGYRAVGPTRGAILMLFEPLVGILLAALLLAERPTSLQLVGGVLVLAGAGLAQLGPRAGPVAPGVTPAE